MYPAAIGEYVAPATVDEALKAMAGAGGDAHFIAGGQSLMQAVKTRLVQPDCLIDLAHVGELKGIRVDTDGVHIGPMTRYRDMAGDSQLDGAYQALRDGAARVGDRQVRNRGTIGGSLCWNFIAACMPPVVIGLGAQVTLASSDGGRRSMAAEEFIQGPLETAREDNELLVAIDLPPAPSNAGSAYKKWGLVTDALPVIGVCAYVEVDGSGACTSARLAVGGLETGPRRSGAGEAALAGKSADDDEGIAAALAAAAGEIDTQADMWADSDYRKVLIGDLGQTVVKAAFARAHGHDESHPHLRPLGM